MSARYTWPRTRFASSWSIPNSKRRRCRLEFTSRGGWLLAGFGNAGWLGRLSEKELRPLHNALVTLYKLAGVDLVREQLQAVLPPEAAAADLSPQGIFIRQDGKAAPLVIYDLITPADTIVPQLLDGLPAEGWPTLTHRQLLFSKVPVIVGRVHPLLAAARLGQERCPTPGCGRRSDASLE